MCALRPNHLSDSELQLRGTRRNSKRKHRASTPIDFICCRIDKRITIGNNLTPSANMLSHDQYCGRIIKRIGYE